MVVTLETRSRFAREKKKPKLAIKEAKDEPQRNNREIGRGTLEGNRGEETKLQRGFRKRKRAL